MNENVAHPCYLYWNRPNILALGKDIFLVDQDRNRVYRITRLMEYMYFEEEDEYGPKQLL
jgi:hypothetical protein